MPSYILTGAPGSGKTAIIRQLEADGCRVVEEAATDVIALQQARGQAEPWASAGFIDAITDLQRRRQQTAPCDGGAVFFDRSPVCALALARWLGYPPSARLTAELDRVLKAEVYAPDVFFVRSMGFVTPTPARQISLDGALAFEDVHRRAYAELGFRLIEVPPGPVADRAALVRRRAALR